MAACCALLIGSASIATNGLYTVAEQAQIPNLPAVIEDGNREIEPSLLGSRLMLTTSYKKRKGGWSSGWEITRWSGIVTPRFYPPVTEQLFRQMKET
jgi:hypothetical protein